MLKVARELKDVKETNKEILDKKDRLKEEKEEAQLSRERLKVLNAQKMRRIRELEFELDQEKQRMRN